MESATDSHSSSRIAALKTLVASLFGGVAASAISTPRAADAQQAASVLAAFPRGVIIPWYAKSGAFPQGWAICDGANGTPDLRGRFLYGVGNMNDVGGNGGSAKHSHPISNVSVSVSGTTATTQQPGSTSDPYKIDDNKGCCPQVAGLAHNHAFSGTGAANGNTQEADSLPPYITVLYMMKL